MPPLPPPGLLLPTPLMAITIAQPWPRMFLLEEDPKRIENRTWTPPRKLVGQLIALHGGRPPRTSSEFDEARAAVDWCNLTQWGGEQDPEDWAYDEDILQACVGGIFAVARIAGVTTDPALPWRTQDPYGWVLEDFTPLPQPVPCSGSQGLWAVQGDLLARVRRELGLDLDVDVGVTPDSPVPASPPGRVHLEHVTPPPAPLFRPGRAVTSVPHTPEAGRLYGMAAGSDWVTFCVDRVTRKVNGQRQVVSEIWSWCSRQTSGMGTGDRGQFLAWLGHLQQGRAA